MTCARVAVFGAAVVLALVGCSSIPDDASETCAGRALAPFVADGRLPAAISVFYRDGVQEVALLGYADEATGRKVAMDSVFMQCSQTKGFCGVTIAMLVEEGKISLDDPVAKYLPEFRTLWVKESVSNETYVVRKARNELTIRNVMNHTGGFDFELPAFRAQGWARRMPLRSVALEAAAQPLLFEPGTNVRYSNVGIDIGAAIVEVVTGKRWEEFLQERVLTPLEMDDTTFWPSEGQLSRLIAPHRCRKGQSALRIDEFADMRRPYNDDRVFPSAGAGLWTTAADQLKFYKMLMNLGLGDNGVRILKEETVQKYLATSTRPLEMEGYSLGLVAPRRDGVGDWFGHGGARGTNCMVNWHKKELKLWVVQLEGGPRPWDEARNRAEREFFSRPIDNSAIDAYTGRMQ